MSETGEEARSSHPSDEAQGLTGTQERKAGVGGCWPPWSKVVESVLY